MKTDWSYLSYHLATMGIPSIVDEDIATNTENDPWVPADGEEIVRIAITKEDAGRMAALIADYVMNKVQWCRVHGSKRVGQLNECQALRLDMAEGVSGWEPCSIVPKVLLDDPR